MPNFRIVGLLTRGFTFLAHIFESFVNSSYTNLAYVWRVDELQKFIYFPSQLVILSYATRSRLFWIKKKTNTGFDVYNQTLLYDTWPERNT